MDIERKLNHGSLFLVAGVNGEVVGGDGRL